MNSVQLIGRLTNDPEMKYLQNGTAVTTFNLAINREYSKAKKQEVESKGQPTADFVRINTFGKLAENCANHLKKGRLTAVEGRIQTGSYNAADGTKKYTFDIAAKSVEFLEWATNKKKEPGQDGFDPVDEEDIPF